MRKIYGDNFFIIKIKSSLRPFLSSLPFPKLGTQNLMYFGHEDVESGPSWSYKLPTFFKYHMPLKKNVKFLKIQSLYK